MQPPLQITCDLAASCAALRSATNPEAALARMLQDAARGAWLAGHTAGVQSASKRAQELLPSLLAAERARGVKSGRRELVLPPELLTALKSLAESRPVVNVAAPNVTVEHQTIVPQRAIKASQQRDGSLLLEPVADE